MAARLNNRHQAMVREKIRASQLINRLQDYVLGKKEVRLSPAQVTAALGLLKKAVPDLQQTTLTGPDGGAVELKWPLAKHPLERP